MYQRILCATDGSEHGDRALRHAARQALATGGELHVVHVIERIPGGGRLRGENVFVTERELTDEIRAQAAQLAQAEGIDATVHVVRGNGQPARPLARLADQLDVDLIVLGTRGHSPVAGIVLGSVTLHLLHMTGRPVLALPPERVTQAGAVSEPREPAGLTAAAA